MSLDSVLLFIFGYSTQVQRGFLVHRRMPTGCSKLTWLELWTIFSKSLHNLWVNWNESKAMSLPAIQTLNFKPSESTPLEWLSDLVVVSLARFVTHFFGIGVTKPGSPKREMRHESSATGREMGWNDDLMPVTSNIILIKGCSYAQAPLLSTPWSILTIWWTYLLGDIS